MLLIYIIIIKCVNISDSAAAAGPVNKRPTTNELQFLRYKPTSSLHVKADS